MNGIWNADLTRVGWKGETMAQQSMQCDNQPERNISVCIEKARDNEIIELEKNIKERCYGTVIPQWISPSKWHVSFSTYSIITILNSLYKNLKCIRTATGAQDR